MKINFTLTRVKAVVTGVFITLLLLCGNLLQAQSPVNLAPSAATNGNGSGTVTPYLWNWANINNLSYSTCGSQEAFIWTLGPPNGSEWMEWAWSSQYPIDKITFHHAQTTGRFLAGGTIQYWDGSSWVNHYNFTNNQANCVNDVVFPLVVTDKIRISNWVSGTGQNSNFNYREIEIWQGARPGTHGLVFDTYMKARNCGNTSDSVSVAVRNVGVNKFGNFWIGAKVTGTANGSPVNLNDSVFISDSIITGQTKVYNVSKINTINGATLNIRSWVRVTNDADKTDDSLTNAGSILGGPSGTPSPSNGSRCGSGRVSLTGGAVSGNTVFWYDKASGGTLIGTGNSFNTPPIAAPNTVTYYAAGTKISGDSSLSHGTSGNTWFGAGFPAGNMFDVNVKKAITIDSFNVHLNTTGKQTVSFYMKAGGWSGSQSSTGAWTLVERKEVTGKGFTKSTPFTLTKPLYLAEGSYAFYLYADQNMIFEQVGPAAVKVSNTAFEAIHGAAIRDTFNYTGTGMGVPTSPNVAFKWNGNIFYHESCISSTRIAVTATAKPLPVGASLNKGTNFKGIYDAGTPTQPDVVANPDQLEYDIQAPSGIFNNSNYGASNQWYIPSYDARTLKGTVVPSGDLTFTAPSGSTSGKIVYKPSSTYTDSTIILTVNLRRNDNGCDSVLTRYIFVAPRPKADFTFTTPCFGDYVDFTNKATISSGTITYLWDFADGKNSNLSDPSHLYGVAGTYNVIFKAISNYGYVDSSVKAVVVNQIPKANFDFVNACEGDAIKLINSSTLPPGTPTYTWIADGNTLTGSSTSWKFSQPGIYPVSLTVEVNGCLNTVTKYVTQAPRGVPSFTVDLGNCDNKDVKFTSTSKQPAFGSFSYTYKFGDGSQASGPVVTHAYNSFNSYVATLIGNTDLGCTDSTKVTVSLRESPKPAFTKTGGLCTNEELTFTNSTNVPAGSTNSYQWGFGDAFTSSDANPKHAYAASGTYEVMLKAQSTNGCEGETKSTITIGEKPTAGFVANKVCKGTATEFMNNSFISNGTLTYSWDLGNGTKTTVTNPSETYATAGTFNAVLITSAGACSDTAAVQVVVAAIPAINIDVASNSTGDGKMKFATNTTGVTYNWQFGDGGSSDIQNPVYKYPFNSMWTVRLTVTSPDGCTNMMSKSIFVNSLSTGDALDAPALAVYPNPGTGLFNIRYAGNATVQKIVITDMLGKQVATPAPGFVNSHMAFDISNQMAGVYFVTLTDSDGNTFTQKVTLSK